MPESLAHLLQLLKSFSVFAEFDAEQLLKLAAFAKVKSINKNNVLIEENNKAKYFYLLVSGSCAVVGQKLSNKIVYDTIYPGEVIGELPLFCQARRTASVIARSPAVVIAIPIQRFQELAKTNEQYAKALTAIARSMAKRLTATKKNYIEIYKKFHNLNDSMIFNITGISLFIFIVPIIKLLHEKLAYDQLINTLVIGILGLATLVSARYAKVAWKDLGLSFENWRLILRESLFFTFLALVGLLVLRYVVLYYYPNFNLAGLLLENQQDTTLNLYVAISIYVVFCSIQEFIARGCLQGPMSKLLIGRHTELKAILISNLLFSSFHVVYSYPLAIVTFVPGLFWGWLYSRNKSLLGVSLSHAILGSAVLFFL